MRSLMLLVGLVVIWGMLVWGNVALVRLTTATYEEQMEENYLVNRYSGKVLLERDEYTDLKRYLLNPEVKINKLDVYASDGALVIYNISSPEYCKSEILGEPNSQEWRYERGRGMDYVGYGVVMLFSVAVGMFASLAWLATVGVGD